VEDGSDRHGVAPTEDAESDDVTPGVERLLALSDGVVAIALTLLVLQLVVPPIAGISSKQARSWYYLWTQLRSTGVNQFTAYVISFYVIAQFWLTHHRVFRSIEGHVEGLAWWNFAFLFSITLMPFTSDLLGRFGDNPLAIDIFAFNLLLASLTTQGVRLFARSHGLQNDSVNAFDIRAGYFRGLWVMTMVLIAATVAWSSTRVASLWWLTLLPAYPVSKWLATRYPGRPPRPAVS
jgi:uncharacterized membrane protein